MTAAAALAAALLLGLPCYPVARSKRPTSLHGHLDATADPEALRRLWRDHPGPLVAIATGAIAGIDVLDIDAPRHPEAGAWFAEHRCRLPVTREHRSRSGGLRLLFEHGAGVRCSASRLARGVDVRGDGGSAIWWPAAGLPVLCDAPPAPWPQWLLDELQPPQQIARSPATEPLDDRRLSGLVRAVARAEPGRRNTVLYWAACRLAEAATATEGNRFGSAVLVAAAVRAGLPAAEAERTVASALARH